MKMQLLVCAHIHKEKKQIGCHSDCHKGDKKCQVLSPRGEKKRGGGDKYGPNTQNVTVTQLHTFNIELVYWQRQKQECTALYCNTHTFPHIQQSRACQGARKLFDCKSLSASCEADCL